MFPRRRPRDFAPGENMGDKCFELNPGCMARAEGDARKPCPAYERQIGCHEMDLKPMYENLTAEQRRQMRRWMQSHCPACPAYPGHRTIIDAKIAAM